MLSSIYLNKQKNEPEDGLEENLHEMTDKNFQSNKTYFVESVKCLFDVPM